MVYTALDARNLDEFDLDALKTSIIDNQFADTSMGSYAVYWLNRDWWTNLGVAVAISDLFLSFFIFWLIYDYSN